MARRPGPQRTPEQRAADRSSIAALYRSGLNQAAIAAQVGLSQQQVSKELAALQDDWVSSGLRNYDRAIVDALKKIDELELIYWAAWRDSKADKSACKACEN